MRGGTTYRVGRDPESNIVMTDSRVSWSHAVLRVDEDVWIFEDLGSKNGTFLGMRRISRIEISTDSVVRLGNADDGPVLRCTPQMPTIAARVIGSLGDGNTGRPSLEPASVPAPGAAAPVGCIFLKGVTLR